jgi:hypothetical protein
VVPCRRDSRPLRLDPNHDNWARDNGQCRQFRFLKTSYTKLENEYQTLKSQNPTDNEIKIWADAKHTKLMEFMVEVNELETWSRQHLPAILAAEAAECRRLRTEYFKERALDLSPPMSFDILKKMAAFKASLKVRDPPSERSWKGLKEKIQPYRSHAEHVLSYEKAMDALDIHNPHISRFRALYDHRRSRMAIQPSLKPEQEYVLALGRVEFNKCIQAGVADEDLLLLCLRNIYDAYSRKKDKLKGLNFDGSHDTYRLSLDDAKMIVEDVMEKQIPRNTPRGRVVFQSLKCRGCTRTDHVRTWSFVEGFEHILQTHSLEVGEGLEFYHFAIPYPKAPSNLPYSSQINSMRPGFKFPWYTAFWPRSLPFAPCHQIPVRLGNWHPAIAAPYEQVIRPSDTSAFAGRIPSNVNGKGDDFAGNMMHAISALSGLRLQGPIQMKIALKFAAGLHTKVTGREPPLSTFMDCLDDLKDCKTDIQLKFECGVCVSDEDRVHHNARTVRYRKALDSLERHWSAKHQSDGISWVDGFMRLPSESDVLQQILKSDKKLREEKQAVQTRNLSLPSNIHKKPDPKASVILEQRFAMDVFNELFPRDNVS